MTTDTEPLHPSHRWGQRPYMRRIEGNLFSMDPVPCCMNCLVDGFEDEPAAFEECRRQDNPAGAKRKKADLLRAEFGDNDVPTAARFTPDTEGRDERMSDHPHTDPGDGRTECQTCGKWVWLVTHSCKGVPVTQAAMDRMNAPARQVSVTDTSLLPAESMALTVALAQTLRGETPEPNVTCVVVYALARLTGRYDWTAGAADE